MAERTEIHTDGTFNDQTGVGGRAAVVARTAPGRQDVTSYEMARRALVEAVQMADRPCTVITGLRVSSALGGTEEPEVVPDPVG